MLEDIQTLFSGDNVVNDSSLSGKCQGKLTKKDRVFFRIYQLGASLTFSVDPSAEVWWSVNGRYDFFSYGKLPGRTRLADYENSPVIMSID